MSRGRFLAGLISGIIGAVAVMIWGFSSEFSEFGTVLLVGYIAFALLSQLIWWRGFAIKLFLLIIGVGLWVLRLVWNFFTSGNGILFIIALFILFPCLSFFCGCIVAAVTVACVVGMVSAPILLFTVPREIY